MPKKKATSPRGAHFAADLKVADINDTTKRPRPAPTFSGPLTQLASPLALGADVYATKVSEFGTPAAPGAVPAAGVPPLSASGFEKVNEAYAGMQRAQTQQHSSLKGFRNRATLAKALAQGKNLSNG